MNKTIELGEVIQGDIRVSMNPEQVVELIGMLSNSLRVNGFNQDCDLFLKTEIFYGELHGGEERVATLSTGEPLRTVKGKFEQLRVITKGSEQND